ncbi:hypothetical protein ES703_79740 [subsurface metagenome]
MAKRELPTKSDLPKFSRFSILKRLQEKGREVFLKISSPILYSKVYIKGVVKGLETMVPRIAENLFALKKTAVGKEKSIANPKVGKIPQKTPMATTRAILCGESSTRTSFLVSSLRPDRENHLFFLIFS